MGVDAGDFDNDGDEDLFMTDLTGEGNNLYVNDGTGRLRGSQRAVRARPAEPRVHRVRHRLVRLRQRRLARHPGGQRSDQARIEELGARTIRFRCDQRKQLFRNLGNGRFEDVTARAGASSRRPRSAAAPRSATSTTTATSTSWSATINGPARLLINNIGNQQSLARAAARRGTHSGATWWARASRSCGRTAPTLWRRARADGSYASANDPRVLVGLGDSTAAPLRSGPLAGRRRRGMARVAIDRWTTLTEGSGPPTDDPETVGRTLGRAPPSGRARQAAETSRHRRRLSGRGRSLQRPRGSGSLRGRRGVGAQPPEGLGLRVCDAARHRRAGWAKSAGARAELRAAHRQLPRRS